MMPADGTGRAAMQRRSDAIPGRTVLPLELGMQVRAAQPPLQLTATTVTESVIERVKVVAEADGLAGQIGRRGQILGSHVGPDHAPDGGRRCRRQ